ncbi:unnamed protein product [Urochloa decumbens]|uniref:F-box domain-containing protein n=1 Tax=Urochloa decumbens TaxID=240449 RepID=A0ABC9AKN9_9POAL
MARRSRKKQRVSSLPDDLIVEILSRVPYRSLCLFKCVSRSWLALCSDPDLRKKSPQTLSGFFCYPRSRHEDDDYDYGPHLINLSGRGRPVVDPSPPLLEGYASRPLLLQCCSSLLLWRVWRSCLDEPKYIVSNPATQKWILLPPTEARDPYPLHFVRLGFDPAAMPSCFFVFMFVTTGHYRDRNRITGVKIYSSETGGWIFRQSEWEDDTTMGRCRGQDLEENPHATELHTTQDQRG